LNKICVKIIDEFTGKGTPQQRYNWRHPERIKATSKDYNIRTKYKITLADVRVKLKEQDNKCMICTKEINLDVDSKDPTRAYIDHDHTTNKVRDLLCARCNSLVGYIETSSDLIEKVLKYVEFHKT
jgi:hypothetical protein